MPVWLLRGRGIRVLAYGLLEKYAKWSALEILT